MRGLLLLGLLIFGFWGYIDYSRQREKERQEAEETACRINPTCSDKKANREARIKSIRDSSPVLSSTGVFYFKGKFCSEDCSGHMAGYKWAEERGISKDVGCTGRSQSFVEGCLQYASERIEELEEGNEKNDHQDDRGFCLSGRYGDC